MISWTAIGAIAGVLATLLIGLWQLPKIRGEARKLNAEAAALEWSSLKAEIDRLQVRVTVQDGRIAELEKLDADRADQEATLKRENIQLRRKVRRLEDRIAGLEAVFKIGPVPPEMQAELDKLKDVE